VLRREVFSYIREGEELVEQPFARLIAERKLLSFAWDGFWQPMDTFKDKITYDRMDAKGDCPWKVWERPPGKDPGRP
jgi:glucose-1-phosphate cytidylyltransferase